MTERQKTCLWPFLLCVQNTQKGTFKKSSPRKKILKLADHRASATLFSFYREEGPVMLKIKLSESPTGSSLRLSCSVLPRRTALRPNARNLNCRRSAISTLCRPWPIAGTAAFWCSCALIRRRKRPWSFHQPAKRPKSVPLPSFRNSVTMISSSSGTNC